MKVSKNEDQEKCEDAFFVHERAIGVADGVGSWNKYGISAAAFANELMDNSLRIIKD